MAFRFLVYVTLGLSFLGMLSCASEEPPLKKTSDPVSEKTIALPPPPANPNPTSQSTTAPDTRSVLETSFVQRHLDENSDFTLEDEQYLGSLGMNPEAQSSKEAAIAVGIVRLTLKVNGNAKAYNESELLNSTQTQTSSTNKISLEALAIEKNVDLPAAIKRNTLLQTLTFYKLCLRALKASNNSHNFTLSVNDAIAAQLNGGSVASKTAEDTPSSGNSTQITENKIDWSTVELSATDVRIGDNVLMEAQTLADNRRYQEAIAKANQIPSSSPLYGDAQLRVKDYSDRAVQDLRQKAAQAFQNSIKVTDNKTRAAYLSSAKAHLEQALREYPNTPDDQLTTIRENLAVISRDLEKLESVEPKN